MRPSGFFHLERLKDRNVYELSSGRATAHLHLVRMGNGPQIFFCWMSPRPNLDFAATQQFKRDSACPEKAGQNAAAQRAPTLLSCRHCQRILGHGRRRDQRKITAAEAKAFSVERRQTLSLRTLDLAEITVPEKEPLPKKPRRTALAVSDVCYTYAGRPEIPSLVSAFPSVSMRSSALWAQTAAAKRPSAS